jgi:hypothetical protein
MLKRPFESGDITFIPIALDGPAPRGLYLPAVRTASIYGRLNVVAGPEAWSVAYDQEGSLHACRLQIGQGVREGYARFRYTEENSRNVALQRAMCAFGIVPGIEKRGPMLLRYEGGTLVDRDKAADEMAAIGVIAQPEHAEGHGSS